ncbi:MAG: aconitate hydratase, partial [Clostridiales bacterium]|nr:aconitate hydratase [Clostridiales bacterium]
MHNVLNEKARDKFILEGKTYEYYSLQTLEEAGYDIKHLPYSIKVLLESVLRQCDGHVINEDHIRNLANWAKKENREAEVPFRPARVILQDFTGVPAVVDLASMRDVLFSVGKAENKDDKILDSLLVKINPEVPVDLVIDHSVQVDFYGSETALEENMKLE